MHDSLNQLSDAFNNVNNKQHKRKGHRPSYNSAYHNRNESHEGYVMSEHVKDLEKRVQQLEQDNKLLMKALEALFRFK